MGFKRTLALAVTAVMVFVSGIAVGQETVQWKVRKYLVPSQATELDRQFLEMQIQEIEDALNVLEESAAPNRTGVPSFSVNPKTGQIQVLLVVHGNWADEAPLTQVENSLTNQAQATLAMLKLYLPGISDRDVSMYFTKIDSRKNEIVNNFAEYKNGQLTIRTTPNRN